LGEARGSLRRSSPALVIIAVMSRALRDENLGDVVLGLIRTRADLHRWGAANAHGRQMHEAVGLMRDAAGSADPAALLAVVEKAIAAAVRVILRADDSSGIIGDAIRDLLALHAQVASEARPSASKLVAWMIKFQFGGTQDFFSIDVADYAPVLGPDGLALYRAKLAEIAGRLGPEPADFGGRLTDPEAWRKTAHDRHTRFLLEHNARRLAVVDRDVDAIIATHARDRKVAAWLQETAQALAEIGEVDLAIDWAKQAADFDGGHQSLDAAGYWCELLAQYRPDAELAARLEVFRRWPSSWTAERLRRAAGQVWPVHRDEVLDTLARSPRDAVVFALHHLGEVELAWALAHNLGLTDARTWSEVANAYEQVDPLGVLPVLRDLVVADLRNADARGYQQAARRLRRMRRLAAGTDRAGEVEELIGALREEHRRRPRLQREFDQAGLP
jgi:tetratricopeptide (TPR) repeat protein